jgi:hypothetical protein
MVQEQKNMIICMSRKISELVAPKIDCRQAFRRNIPMIIGRHGPAHDFPPRDGYTSPRGATPRRRPDAHVGRGDARRIRLQCISVRVIVWMPGLCNFLAENPVASVLVVMERDVVGPVVAARDTVLDSEVAVLDGEPILAIFEGIALAAIAGTQHD